MQRPQLISHLLDISLRPVSLCGTQVADADVHSNPVLLSAVGDQIEEKHLQVFVGHVIVD